MDKVYAIVTVRINPSIYTQAKDKAREAGVSFTRYVETALELANLNSGRKES